MAKVVKCALGRTGGSGTWYPDLGSTLPFLPAPPSGHPLPLFAPAGATQLSDRLTAAAWWGWGWGAQHAAAGSAQAAAEATGAAPPGDALTAAPLPASTRRGFRLATLPDPDSGRSYMLSCSSTAWGGASGAEGRQGGCGGMLAVEASAALPVAHGVVLTPGLVVLRRTVGCGSSDGVGGVRAGGGVTVLCAALGTQWSF